VSGEGTCVLLYSTIHDVMRAEKLLKQAELWSDLIPTPRQLSSECGMALQLRPADLTAALGLLSSSELLPRIYRQSGGTFELLE